MTLEEIKRPSGIPESHYAGTMSLIAENGGPAFHFLSCKEEMYHALGKAVGFSYESEFRTFVMGPSTFYDNLDANNPGIVLYVDSSIKFEKARRINSIVCLLNERLGLDKKPEVSLYADSCAVLVRVDKWYYKNSVAISALLTFIRAAAYGSYSFDTIDEFVTKGIEKKKAGQDSYHLAVIRDNGNLEGFLNKTLPILNRDNAWHLGRKTDIPYDGIVQYSAAESSYTDISGGLSEGMFHEDLEDEDYDGGYNCGCDYCV